MRDGGMFAMTKIPEAPIFLKWLASAIPPAPLNELIPPGAEVARSVENL